LWGEEKGGRVVGLGGFEWGLRTEGRKFRDAVADVWTAEGDGRKGEIPSSLEGIKGEIWGGGQVGEGWGVCRTGEGAGKPPRKWQDKNRLRHNKKTFVVERERRRTLPPGTRSGRKKKKKKKKKKKRPK